jgi:hypothetical protein
MNGSEDIVSEADYDDTTFKALVRFNSRVNAVYQQATLLQNGVEECVKRDARGENPERYSRLNQNDANDYNKNYANILSSLITVLNEIHSFTYAGDADQEVLKKLYEQMGFMSDVLPPPVTVESIKEKDEKLTAAYHGYVLAVKSVFDLYAVDFPQELSEAHNIFMQGGVPEEKEFQIGSKISNPPSTLAKDTSAITFPTMSAADITETLSPKDAALLERLDSRVSGYRAFQDSIFAFVGSSLKPEKLFDEESLSALKELSDDIKGLNKFLSSSMIDFQQLIHFAREPEDVRLHAVKILKTLGRSIDNDGMHTRIPVRITSDRLLDKDAEIASAFKELLGKLEYWLGNSGKKLPAELTECAKTFTTPLRNIMLEAEKNENPAPSLILSKVAEAVHMAMRERESGESPQR